MKKFVTILATFTFIVGFTSCRDTTSTDSRDVDILESPEETTIEEVQEDTTTVDSVETDTMQRKTDTLQQGTDTLSVNR